MVWHNNAFIGHVGQVVRYYVLGEFMDGGRKRCARACYSRICACFFPSKLMEIVYKMEWDSPYPIDHLWGGVDFHTHSLIQKASDLAWPKYYYACLCIRLSGLCGSPFGTEQQRTGPICLLTLPPLSSLQSIQYPTTFFSTITCYSKHLLFFFHLHPSYFPYSY